MDEGYSGTHQTLIAMRGIVRKYRRDQQLREYALNLVRGVQEKNWRVEITAVFNFVRDSIRYVMDVNEVETLSTPDVTIEVGQGDCDDKVILLATLLEAIGHPTRFVVVGYVDADSYEHVYLETRVGDEWIALDATENVQAGWEPPNPVAKKVFYV